MSDPIPIVKKEEDTGGYFASWFKKFSINWNDGVWKNYNWS